LVGEGRRIKSEKRNTLRAKNGLNVDSRQEKRKED